jgi:uncharacterized protein
MNPPVVVESLSLYPIKSLDPVVVPATRVLSSGALEHDREFALFDEHGNWINGKREPRIHLVRADYDLDNFVVALRSSEESQHRPFHLLDNRRELEEWFGNFFGLQVSLKRNTQTGFPDDLESPGPTIVSSGTLSEVSSWFNITDTQETRRRFRPNIEIAAETPFWEDRLFGDSETTVDFQIGDVTVHGVNPCQRCIVPSRNPSTGAVTRDFQRVFATKREETLPLWATKTRFNHFYRLTINTRIPSSEAGKLMRFGDILSVQR